MRQDPSTMRRMAKLLIADDLVPIRQMVRITLSTQGDRGVRNVVPDQEDDAGTAALRDG